MKKRLLMMVGMMAMFAVVPAFADETEITTETEMEIQYSDDSSDFVLLTDAVPDAILEIRYYSTYNFVGDRIDGYEEPLAFLTKEAAEALKAVSDDLVEKGYRLKIYDAYRPQKAVANFVDWALDPDDTRMKEYFYPELDKEDLFPQEYIMEHSGHTRGSTVDLTLFDMETEKEVDMGGTFDYFGELSHPDYKGITEEQYENRMILRDAMLAHGFRPLETEWWHFTLDDEPYTNTYFTFPINSDSLSTAVGCYAESDNTSERKQITKDFISLLEDDPELETLMEKSIYLAAINNPDRKTNPVQSLDEYYDFLDWSATCMPWNILDGQDTSNLYGSIDQSLDYFYYLLDQPLPELAGEGLYYPCLEYYEPVSSWCKQYASEWGEFLSSEESWNDEYYRLVCADKSFGMDKGWYSDKNEWKSFNEWFSRRLVDENQRPISDADVIAPADLLMEEAYAELTPVGQEAADAMETESERVDIKDRKLTEEELNIAKHVIENFLKMENVPRPSGHEEKISAFFMDWAKEQGFDPVQDEVLNVVFDVPATEGYEDYPMVGLQAHMDMVCVGDSPDYDPENDPIKVVVDYDAATMTADGTSLGADDGIGCAIIMSMAQGLAPHGPLRVILTVNEEDTMAGIMNLDPETVADLPYLINVDSEVSDAVTVSTAGGVQIDVTDEEVQTKVPDGACAMELIVSGAKGGHSGMDINKGRLNAIYAMEGILKELSERNIPYEIASFEGGTASNAIPAEAKAVIMLRSEDQENVTQTAADMETSLKEEYKDTEENLSVRAGVINAVVEEVVAPEETQKAFAFMDGIVNGVYSMSEDIEGLVESSSNLGVITLTPEQFRASCYERSSNAEKTDEILAIDQEAIDAGGFESVMEPSGDPWPYNPDSVLLPLTQKVYLEQNGEEIKVETLHATLECGTFAVMNPSLDMVSIGPDLVDVHSTSEMIYLRTIPKTFNLLAGILNGIGATN